VVRIVDIRVIGVDRGRPLICLERRLCARRLVAPRPLALSLSLVTRTWLDGRGGPALERAAIGDVAGNERDVGHRSVAAGTAGRARESLAREDRALAVADPGRAAGARVAALADRPAAVLPPAAR